MATSSTLSRRVSGRSASSQREGDGGSSKDSKPRRQKDQHTALGRVLRLIRVATEIKANPKTTPEALRRALGVSRSQFYKDRRGLALLGFEFRYSRKERLFRVVRDAFLPAQDLTFPERFALVLAVRQFLTYGDYALGVDALTGIRKLIGQSVKEEGKLLRETLDDVVLRHGFGCDPSVLEALQKAMAERRRISLRQRSIREGRFKTWTVDPCALLFRRRALYLDAYALEAREYRMFRANRIVDVQILPVRVPPREDYSFVRRHGSAFHPADDVVALDFEGYPFGRRRNSDLSEFAGEDRTRVRVQFDPSISAYVREILWQPSQSLTELPDGGLILEVEVNEPREVGWWTLQWGARAEILAPRELWEELAREIGRLYRLYAARRAAISKKTAEAAAPVAVKPAPEPPNLTRCRL
ncbi:MAG: helix-turn-helix transcriptional regulator [Nitrospinota bacterium]